MKQFKQAALALAMVGMVSAQAHAGEAQVQNLQAAQPITTFSQTDIDAMFEQAGQPMQLAALSQQEMRETEGAFWFMPVLGGVTAGGAYWLGNPSNRNVPALVTAIGMGALGGGMTRVAGLGVGTFGTAYASLVRGWW